MRDQPVFSVLDVALMTSGKLPVKTIASALVRMLSRNENVGRALLPLTELEEVTSAERKKYLCWLLESRINSCRHAVVLLRPCARD